MYLNASIALLSLWSLEFYPAPLAAMPHDMGQGYIKQENQIYMVADDLTPEQKKQLEQLETLQSQNRAAREAIEKEIKTNPPISIEENSRELKEKALEQFNEQLRTDALRNLERQ